MVFSVQSQSKYSKNQSSVAHKATNKYWNTGIVWVALKATGVLKSDPKIWQNSLQNLITAILPLKFFYQCLRSCTLLSVSQLSPLFLHLSLWRLSLIVEEPPSCHVFHQSFLSLCQLHESERTTRNTSASP